MKKCKNNKKKGANKQNIIFGVLIAVLSATTIGFAAYSTTLTIGGSDNLTVKAAKWDVHWDSESYTESTGSVAATSKQVTDNAVTFTVTLTKPGDFYEFTVDAVNDGTFDAEMTALTMSDITAHADYLTYKITYDEAEYTSTTTGLESALDAGASKTAKVRVDYVLPDESAKLPTEDVTVTLTAAFTYDQV